MCGEAKLRRGDASALLVLVGVLPPPLCSAKHHVLKEDLQTPHKNQKMSRTGCGAAPLSPAVFPPALPLTCILVVTCTCHPQQHLHHTAQHQQQRHALATRGTPLDIGGTQHAAQHTRAMHPPLAAHQLMVAAEDHAAAPTACGGGVGARHLHVHFHAAAQSSLDGSAAAAAAVLPGKVETQHSRTSALGQRRRRPWLRAAVWAGAATVALAVGAAGASVALASRMEQLELTCAQMSQQQEQLAASKQQLAAQVDALLVQQQRLGAHKEQLQQRLDELQEQDEGHREALQGQLAALRASQQKLQHTTAQLAAEVAAARQPQEQQQQHSECDGAAAPPAAHKQKQRQRLQAVPTGSTAAAAGDLRVEVTVPGFTDALVSRIGDADIVPQFVEALVKQVRRVWAVWLVHPAVVCCVLVLG